MNMLIRPDPEHPAGGYAVLSLPGHSALPDAMTVSVMETFGGRWLAPSAEDASGRIGIGDPNWQPVAHGFGSIGSHCPQADFRRFAKTAQLQHANC